MIIFRSHSISIMVLYAAALHLMWAMLILMGSEEPIELTTIQALYRIFNSPTFLASVLIGISLCSLVGTYIDNWAWTTVLLIPQQLLLLIVATWAASLIYTGQSPTGNARSHINVAINQVSYILLAITHSVAVTMHVVHRRK